MKQQKAADSRTAKHNRTIEHSCLGKMNLKGSEHSHQESDSPMLRQLEQHPLGPQPSIPCLDQAH